MRVLTCSLAFALVFPLCASCAAKRETTFGAVAPLRAAPSPGVQTVTEGGFETGGLHIGEAIVRACGLRRAPAPPMFDYDSARLAEDDRVILSKVAKCFSEGPLRGQGVALTGRADPRGEDEYNMALGESRADSVRRYLHDMGVAPQHVDATSRGKLDANGKDEEGWAKDRRVDIELASR
jgi:peptidoglycan-associated lipoprotein